MEAPTSILIVRFSAIGDIILTTPLVRQLRARYPKSKIDFLTKPAFKPLLQNSPYINNVISIDDFQPQNYSIVIDLQNNLKSRRITKKTAPKIYKYYKHNWRKFFLVHFKVDFVKHHQPVPERYKEDLLDLNIQDDQLGCEIFLSDDEESFAKAKINQEVKNVAICFGATHFTKRYPTVLLIQVIEKLYRETDATLMLMGGKDESKAADDMLKKLSFKGRVQNFTGKTSLLESAALLKYSDVVLSNDTGLMHMASAFNKKMVVLFGSSVRQFGFAPYRAQATILENLSLSCRPCSHIGKSKCPKKHFKCMRELSPDNVAQTVIDLLKD